MTSQSRPFSASSSSCSSIESSAENTHHYSHSSTLNPLVGVSASINPQSVTDFSLSNSCFSTHSSSHHPAPNWGNANLHHHEFKHEFSHHTPHAAGYTSVIVDSQQYQLANEYVHWEGIRSIEFAVYEWDLEGFRKKKCFKINITQFGKQILTDKKSIYNIGITSQCCTYCIYLKFDNEQFWINCED